MSDNGWIKLHRQATESAVFSDAWAWQLFCWCLLKANHKKRPWKGREIPRGSFATGRKSAAEQLGVSESKFRRGLEKLKSFGVITTQATNKYTIVRVEKYESFQKRDDEADQQATIKRPSSDQQPTTNKNGKKVKNKRFDPLAIELPESLQGEGFRVAWQDWCSHRAEIKKNLTLTSTEKHLKVLGEMGLQRAVAAIENSIANGWQGIFEPKGPFNSDTDTARRISE